MLGLIVKVSTFDDIVFKKDLHIFPWISNRSGQVCGFNVAVHGCDDERR